MRASWIWLISTWVASAANPRCFQNRPATGRPVSVVGHQGGGGTAFRKSSLAAYRAAAESAAVDFLECDLTSTADGVLVCSHSPDLSSVVDPSSFHDWFWSLLRKTKELLQPLYDPHSLNVESPLLHQFEVEDWFVPDFTWRLISQLSARCPAGPNVTCPEINPSRLARVDELIELAYSRRDKAVGLYLEIKSQMWHMSRRSVDLIDSLFKLLRRYDKDLNFPFPVYLQSFEYADLVRLRDALGYETNICIVALAEDTTSYLGEHPARAKSLASQEESAAPGCEALDGISLWTAVWVDLKGERVESGYQAKNFCPGLGYFSTVRACVSPDVKDWKSYCERHKPPAPSLSCPTTRTPSLTNGESFCPAGGELLPFWTGNEDAEALVDLTCLADVVAPDYKMVTSKLAKQLQTAGLALHVWTMNDPHAIVQTLTAQPYISGVIVDEGVAVSSHSFFNITRPSS